MARRRRKKKAQKPKIKRETLIENYLEARWENVRDRFKALNPYIWEPRTEALPCDQLLELAGELLGVSSSKLAPVLEREPQELSGHGNRWSSELRPPVFGNFECDMAIREISFRDGRAGIQVVRSGFGDAEVHPKVRVGDGDRILRAWDMDEGWVMAAQCEAGSTLGVSAPDFNARDELRQLCHSSLR